MHRHHLFSAVTALSTVAACVGSHGDHAPDSKPPPGISCELPRPGQSPLARLNSRETKHALHDLFDVRGDWGLPKDDSPRGLGFDNSVQNASVSQLRIEALYKAADAAGKKIAQDPANWLSCDPATADDSCIDAFIRTLGNQVYRRPLVDAEFGSLRKVYDASKSRGETIATRLQLVVKSMTFAAQFLYRAEHGRAQAEEVAPGVIPLSDHEVATRMALLFWGSVPDSALLKAADQGLLATREGVEEQARKMLDDPRARRGVVSFLMQWIGVDDLAALTRDSNLYSSYNSTLAKDMEEELRRFFERVVFDKNGSVVDLLQAEETVVNASLASLYGVQHPTGSGWATVSLPEGQRRGVLTLAGFLTNKAHSIQPAPVLRGLFVRTRLLCDTVPEPPDDVDISLPMDEKSNPKTNRELLSQHASDPSCRGCHDMMDPIGFAFENFDSIGQVRNSDNGFAIDTTGELISAGDASGPFNGALELNDLLATSDKVKNCMRLQAFRYATGRNEELQDKCSLQQVEATAAQSGGSIREILVGIATSDAFRFRQEGQ